MKIVTNKRYMPQVGEDVLKDNQQVLNEVKPILLDSRGVPHGTAPWEWIQHHVDPFVNTYAARYQRILAEGWTKYDVDQCERFLFTILANVTEDVRVMHQKNLSLWDSFYNLVKEQE